MSRDEAENAGVDERRRFFKVTAGKANLTIAADAGHWREMVSVSLGNGGDGPHDYVGVPQPWSFPGTFDDVTPDDLAEVQRPIRGGTWRENQQAEDWAGKAVAEVLGLDLEEPRTRKRIVAMLKTWIKNGALTSVPCKDKDRKG